MIKLAAPLCAALLATTSNVYAEASLERGQMLFQTKCSICHSVVTAEGHSVGPNLNGVINRKIGSAEGFTYSAAMSGQPETWTEERLDAFLTSPASDLPGTAMPFSGLKKAEDRQALILFLQSLTSKD
ncbi:MAG: c-type cytochrome [Ectopseudomonas guguanensis]|uniref:c-type cytochrome n=1 Tax=Ectopseudomonas guguanensis TaxID=1198456 RepID=UPI00391C9B02